jgi:hypothetical protein
MLSNTLIFKSGIRCSTKDIEPGEAGLLLRHGLLICPAGSVMFGFSSRMERRGSSITVLIAPAVVIMQESLF